MSLSFDGAPSAPATTTLSLSKGQNISLTKHDPGLTKITVGLGWDVNAFAGGDFDLDASVIAVYADGKVRGDGDFCFYNQPSIHGGAIKSTGDNRTGEGDGDDEQIKIDLAAVPADVQRIVVAVSIYAPPEVTFGQVRNAFVRIVNDDTGNEDARFDLGEDYSAEKALVFAEVYRAGAEWKFKAVGQGYADGLSGLIRDFGLNIGG